MLKNKIYVVGSINIDEKISIDSIPKAGETKHGKNYHISFGGKGANQAIVAASLGALTLFLGRVGNEIQGEEAINEMRKNGVNVESIIKDTTAYTGRAIIIYENMDNRILLAPGANNNVSEQDVEKFIDGNMNDILLVQFEIPLETIWYAIKLAKKKNMIVVVNPAPAKRIPKEILKEIDYLILNQSETELLTGEYPENIENCRIASNKLHECGVKNIVITLGEKGAFYSTKNLNGLLPSIGVNVVDTTGAGDTFLGMFVYKLLEEENIEKIIQYSVVAGALACERENAHDYVPTLEEIEGKLKNDEKNYY